MIAFFLEFLKVPILRLQTFTARHFYFSLLFFSSLRKRCFRVSIFPPHSVLSCYLPHFHRFFPPPIQCRKITPTLKDPISLYSLMLSTIALGLNLYSALLRYITMINGYLINKPNPNWAPERNYQQAIGLHKSSSYNGCFCDSGHYSKQNNEGEDL